MTSEDTQMVASDRLRDANEHLTITALQAEERAEELAQRYQVQNSILLIKQSALRELASQLTVSEQRERKRLAAELHDYLAQMLVLGRMKIGHARRHMLPADLLKAPVIHDLDDILSKALDYTRTLMAELSPSVLHDLGLPAALKWLAGQMHSHNLTVEVQCSQQTVALPEDQAILLFQSIRELLINVGKHAKTSQATVSLMIEGGDHLRITVQDRGCGFELGAPPGTAADEHFGMLSVNERMDAMGGWLTVDSAVGRGTTITLGLPLKEPLDSTPHTRVACAPAGVEPRVTPTRTATGVRSVLLAEDHALVRQGLRAILDGCPDICIVGEAGNGREAVEMASDLKPDVVLMDINMPGMDGIQATQQILAFRPTTVVVGLSVNHVTHTIQAMMDAGASHCLSKDVTAELLHDVLTSASPRSNADSSTQVELPSANPGVSDTLNSGEER
ncbi:MAG: response regulator [Nitrospira sp. BO4]|jgi:signal transduction histidine kinase/AmiR/NasT family two-component response regulator|nr:response regulator [Nitrospira sp. BO4]